MTGAGQSARAIKQLDAGPAGADARRTRRGAAGRTLDEEACDFVAGGEGLVTPRDLVERSRSDRPHRYERVPGLWLSRRAGHVAQTTRPAPLVKRSRRTRCRASPGTCCRWTTYRAAQLALLRRPRARSPTPRSTPRSAVRTTARSAASRRRSRAASRPPGCKTSVNSYRFWSPDARHRRRSTRSSNSYGVRNIKFADEMFVLNRRHVLGICDLIIERGYDLNIWAYARVDTVKDGMLDKLKRAGFNWLAFGIEAADERRADRRRQALSSRTRSTTRSTQVQGRRHQRHRQLHLRPARRRPPTRCRRRSTWRSI